jgi:hypothetical protein
MYGECQSTKYEKVMTTYSDIYLDRLMGKASSNFRTEQPIQS